MRRALSILAIALTLALLASSAAWAHGRRHWRHHHHGGWGPRVVVGVGPPLGWGWGWYHRPYYPAYPPVIVREQPEVYIQRPDPPLEGYWYFCESAGEYYPRVPSCPEPWLPVPPVPE